MTDLKHLIQVVVGDWSEDGHGKTFALSINCSHSGRSLETAYKKGTAKVGFDLVESVADRYEDNELPADKLQALVKNGVKIEFENGVEDDGTVSLTREDFAKLYLAICQLGNPKIEYKKSRQDKVRVRGYGLF
jgi:hypothetical protein